MENFMMIGGAVLELIPSQKNDQKEIKKDSDEINRFLLARVANSDGDMMTS